MLRTGTPYRTESGDLADKQGKPIRRYRGKALERIDELPLLTAEGVERAICGHALGLLRLDKERLLSLRLLGERHGLWGPGRHRLAPWPETRRRPEPFELVVAEPPEGT
jgi:hypothetical protein